MCGIAGIIANRDAAALAGASRRLLAAMAHRGPDSSGQWSDQGEGGRLCLVHTRLAIIDLSPAGAQPMHDTATGNVIVFNGEIYNFKELRKRIEREDPDRDFVSQSDTEVLLRGYALWGTDLFSRLDGMFALLIYDHGERKLVTARDHVGIKPLYFAATVDGGLMFASEVRAIKQSGLWRGGIDSDAVRQFCDFGSIREPRTILTGVQAFPAAHFAVIDLSRDRPAMSSPVCYWDVASACRAPYAGSDPAADHAGLLAATVADQLVSDVPVGIFLSAGIDSTVLAEAVPVSARPRLHAFTVSRRSRDASEARLAALTANNLGIRHTICDVSDEDILSWMREGLAAMDQPSHDGVNVYLVSRTSRQAGIVVALCGAGADELHAGYGHFASLARLADMTARPGFLPLARTGASALALLRKGQPTSERIRLLLAAAPDMAAMVAEKRRYFTPPQISAMWPEAPPGAAPLSSREWADLPALTRVSLAELTGYLKDTLLRDADWAAMANHQELRVPYLGKAYMELSLRLPWALKARRGEVNKPVLSGMISAANRHVVERKKTGFELDYGPMLAGPLREEFVQAASVLNFGFGFTLNPEAMLEGLGEPDAGKRARRVWALFALGSYLARHGGEG